MTFEDFDIDNINIATPLPSEYDLYEREIMEYAGIVPLRKGESMSFLSGCNGFDSGTVLMVTSTAYIVVFFEMCDENEKHIQPEDIKTKALCIDKFMYHNEQYKPLVKC